MADLMQKQRCDLALKGAGMDYLDSILMCPTCRGQLSRLSDSGYRCAQCGMGYPIVDGIPILLPKDLDDWKCQEAECHSHLADNYAESQRLDSFRNVYYHQDFLRPILDLPSDSLVLELGCGTGLDGIELMKRGLNVVETDISLGCVKKARQNSEELGLSSRGRFMVADAEGLPFLENTFDAVLIVGSLHHLPHPEECLAEMRRCAKEQSLVVIGFEPNTWPYYLFFPFQRKILALGRLFSNPAQFFRTSSTVQRILSKLRKAIGRSDGSCRPQLYSPGDKFTRGFTYRKLSRLLDDTGLELVRAEKVWYVNGFIHGFPATCQMQIPHRTERFLVGLDEFLSRLPILSLFNWHWNILARPRALAQPEAQR